MKRALRHFFMQTFFIYTAVGGDGAAQEFHVKVTKDKILLRADKKRIAVEPCAPLLKGHPIDGVEIGHDLGGTVANFGDRFSGTIEAVAIEVK